MARVSLAISTRRSSRRLQSSSLAATSASELTPKNSVIAEASLTLTASASTTPPSAFCASARAFVFSLTPPLVFARPRDSDLDRVGEPGGVAIVLLDSQRLTDLSDIRRKKLLVVLHRGDAVIELGAVFQRSAQGHSSAFQNLAHPRSAAARLRRRRATNLHRPRASRGLASAHPLLKSSLSTCLRRERRRPRRSLPFLTQALDLHASCRDCRLLGGLKISASSAHVGHMREPDALQGVAQRPTHA